MTDLNPLYGIKLVTPDHFKYECFESDFDDQDERSTLMNFKNNVQGIAAAKKLVPGSQAIMYVSREQWFARAFEVTGSVADGQRIAKIFSTPTFNMLASTNPYNIYRPIRWLARVEPQKREDYTKVSARADIEFKPNAYTFKNLGEHEYRRLYGAIHWSWVRTSDPPKAPALVPACAPPVTVAEPRSPAGEDWYPYIVQRIDDVAPLPERNHEDVISDLLKRLGILPKKIIFEHNNIDISVFGDDGHVRVVIEVKQDLNITNQIAGAREQVQRYGQRVGCDHCVITDGDLWELQDLSRGGRYDQRYLGAFRLTDFKDKDAQVYGLLLRWLGV